MWTLLRYNKVTLLLPLLPMEKSHNSYGRFKVSTMLSFFLENSLPHPNQMGLSTLSMYPFHRWDGLKDFTAEKTMAVVDPCLKLVRCSLLVIAGRLLVIVTIIYWGSASHPFAICNFICLFVFFQNTYMWIYICLIKPPVKCRSTAFVYQMWVPLVGNHCIRMCVWERI